jgi:hypothetical protein
MKRLILLVLLLSAPAWSQTRLTPKDMPKDTSRLAGKHVDDCAPIGRTEDGKLVYSMKCETLPAPPAPPPQAEVREAPAPAAEGEGQRSGLFGWSYDRRPKE